MQNQDYRRSKRRMVRRRIRALCLLAASTPALAGCSHVSAVTSLPAPPVVLAPAAPLPAQTVAPGNDLAASAQAAPIWTALQPGPYAQIPQPASAEPDIRLADFHISSAALKEGRSRVNGSIRIDNFGPYNITDYQISLFTLAGHHNYTLIPAQTIAPWYQGTHGQPMPVRQGVARIFDVAVSMQPGEMDGGVNVQIEAQIDGPPGLYVHREGVLRSRSN